ncbi:YcaO-like family protein [Cupriavidus sp. 30B13]|uniref:YcaO-like family protein n=1 Tax=Cupriavidus sp. 30B13 TaxID=3384241 RepID=UPI003B91DD9A
MSIRFEVRTLDVFDKPDFELVRAELFLNEQSKSTGWGRDADVEVAQHKAVGEAFERFAARQLPPSHLAPALALPHYMHPDWLVRYASEQYERPGFPFTRFDRVQPRLWINATEVAGGTSVPVLADHVCMPGAFDKEYRAKLVTHASTSGCATATTVKDAILRATFEVIERDAFMRHWLRQQGGLPVAIPSLPVRFQTRLGRLEEQGCRVGVQCLTLGHHPVWLVWAQSAARHFTAIGTACGDNAERALESACSELETMALVRIEDVEWTPIEPQAVVTPGDHAALYATPRYFRMADALWDRTVADMIPFDDVAARCVIERDALFSKLASADCQVHWVDLTPPDLGQDAPGLHSVRVLMPGAIPMSFGYGRMPLGMTLRYAKRATFPHPFA